MRGETVNRVCAIVPIVMSVLAVLLLVFAFATGWGQGHGDEGAAAHLWQVLIGMVTAQLAWMGEPWKSYFDPAELVAALQALHFAQVSDVGPKELNALYFPGRSDQLTAGGLQHMMTVRV